ncbi:MAG: hypothetical protein KC912_02655 [Proteobacteria bacterium]|nr:hypothetical protein [Pseudomonadota bacterium]
MTLPLSAPDAPPQIVRLDDSVPVVRIPSNLQFEEVREWLRVRLPEHLGTIGGRQTRLDLGDREIRLFDLRRVLSFMRDQFQIEVTGIYARESRIIRYAERELKLKLFPTTPEVAALPSPAELAAELAGDVQLTEEPGPIATDIPQNEQPAPITEEEVDVEDEEPEAVVEPAPEEEPEPAKPQPAFEQPVAALMDAAGAGDKGDRTLTLHRTLRSGACIRYDGDITIFGDVNPGAQLFASGNIVVLGTLKGMAHAGATGAEDSFIFGFDLQPTQLRIGRKIAIVPGKKPGRSGLEPDIARVEDGKIVIEPYKSGSSR